MAIDFYSDAPYLHSMPGADGTKKIDLFTPAQGFLFNTQEEKQKSRLEEMVEQLRRRADESKAIEDKFYVLFKSLFDNKVPSPADWNRKFLGIIQSKDEISGQIITTRLEVGDNPYSKVMLALGDRSFAGMVANFVNRSTANSKRMFNALQAEVVKDGKRLINEKKGKGGYQQLATSLLSKEGYVAQRRLGADGVAGTLRGAINNLEQNIDGFAKLMAKELNEQMNESEEKIIKKARLQLQHFFLNDPILERIMRAEISNRLLGTSDPVSRTSASLKKNVLTLEDFGYTPPIDGKVTAESERDMKRAIRERKAYVKTVADIFMHNIKQYWESDDLSMGSGLVGETTVEVILTLSLNGIARIINTASQQTSKEVNKIDYKHKSHTDLVVRDLEEGWQIALQIKNSIKNPTTSQLRTVGGDIKFNNPSLFKTLIEDLDSKNILNGVDKAYIAYQITNSYYRLSNGSGDSFFQQLGEFLALTVEYFFRIETAKTLLDTQKIEPSNMGNHFLMRPQMGLIGMSHFLYAVADILSTAGTLELSQKSIPISGKISTAGNPLQWDKDRYHFIKKIIVYDAIKYQGQTGPYPINLLSFGKKTGKKLYETIPSPDVFMSVHALAEQIQGLGV